MSTENVSYAHKTYFMDLYN